MTEETQTGIPHITTVQEPETLAVPSDLDHYSKEQDLQTSKCQGNVDCLGLEGISGWVIDTLSPGKRVIVELWIGERCVSQVRANLYRPDVESAGIDDGYSGFKIDLQVPTLQSLDLQGVEIELWTSCNSRRSLLHSGNMPGPFEHWDSACIDQISLAIHSCMLDVPQAQPQHYSFCPTDPATPCITEKLFESCNTSMSMQTTIAVPSPSKYTCFTRDRLNLHKEFDFEQDPRSAIELLVWYLEHYGTSRKPYRIPLSKQEIEFCNELIVIPGTRFSLTRLHYYFYLRKNPGSNLIALLNTETAYCEELTGWATSTCLELNIDDVCVPSDYTDFLRNVDGTWKGKEFPLNRYFELLFAQRDEWQCFDRTQQAHRGALYLLALLEGAQGFNHVHLMPEEVKKTLLSTSEFMTQFNRHIIAPVFERDLNMDIFSKQLESAHLSAGYALRAGAYTSITPNGHRYAFANCSPEASCEQVDVQLIGPLEKASGLGQATRLSARMIESISFSHNFVNFDLDNPAPEGFSSRIKHTQIKNAKINLIHLNAESVPFALAYTPDVYTGSYNIGYFFWELDTPARCHQLALDILDEVWVCSEYGVSQYQNSTQKPVVNVGMSVEEQPRINLKSAKQYLSDEFGVRTNTKVFLATFDSFSFVQRKNPLGVVQAFKHAFNNGEDVCLLLKTQNKTFVGDPVQLKIWKAIEYAIREDPRIRIINRTLPYDELLMFKKAADCYISLHRAEGWGFGMIEAMNLKVPVVATNYSGNLEYCTDENCWLVDAKDQYLSESDYIFVAPGQKWVEPDIAHAAEILQEVHQNRTLGIEKATRAKKLITENFSEIAIAKRYEERLKHILDSLPNE